MPNGTRLQGGKLSGRVGNSSLLGKGTLLPRRILSPFLHITAAPYACCFAAFQLPDSVTPSPNRANWNAVTDRNTCASVQCKTQFPGGMLLPHDKLGRTLTNLPIRKLTKLFRLFFGEGGVNFATSHFNVLIF